MRKVKKNNKTNKKNEKKNVFQENLNGTQVMRYCKNKTPDHKSGALPLQINCQWIIVNSTSQC